MSDKTESQALLSREQVAEIASSAKRSNTLHDETLADFYREDVPALLADRAAFRQQVAAELRLLLYDESIFPQIPPADRVSCMLRNNQVKNAAKALKIDLSAPTY